MLYAVNTPDKVIHAGNLYYLCFQGIWFVAKPQRPVEDGGFSPSGIYTIPPASPMYNVTYVIVSNPTPTTVQTSYSSGYLGVFVMGMAVGSASSMALDITIPLTFITDRTPSIIPTHTPMA